MTDTLNLELAHHARLCRDAQRRWHQRLDALGTPLHTWFACRVVSSWVLLLVLMVLPLALSGA